MSDKRQRPRIHRCDDKHDAALRAYARSRGIEPWQALETAIQRLELTSTARTIETLTKERDNARRDLETGTEIVNRQIAELANARKVAADLRAELASARDATRRADEKRKKALRLASGMRSDLLLEREAREALRVTLAERDTRIAELETALADWREASGEQPAAKGRRRAPEPIACVLPRDLERRAAKLARSRATTREQLINYCVTIGIKRLESVARHAPVQAAREKAKRAAAE